MEDDLRLSRAEAGDVLRDAATATKDDRLTVGELKRAAADVGVSGADIDAAVERRARDKAAREGRRRSVLQWLLRAVVAVEVVALLGMGVSYARRARIDAVERGHAQALHDAAREVDLRRSAVREALARQARVEALMASQPDASMRAAEILGAQNRVSVAMRRYDAAVYRYNGASTRWPPSRSYPSLPARYAFSQEVSQW